MQDDVDGIPKATEDELSMVASLMNMGRIFGSITGGILQGQHIFKSISKKRHPLK